MTAIENKINTLFEELVPSSGKAGTVAGEIIRAVSRIGYRNYNDGDHVGVGYGKETCNPAARYLMARAGEKVEKIIVVELWGEEEDCRYDIALEKLGAAVLEFLENNPELKKAENSEDMWDYRDAGEDVDDSYDEDEDEEEW